MHVVGDLSTLVWTARVMAVVPSLQFVKKEEVKRSGGEFAKVDDVAWVNVGKVKNAWHEDIDLEPFIAFWVVIGVPPEPQYIPRIIGVLGRCSVKLIVCLAKLFLDALCAALIRGETKDVKILM